MNSKEILKFCMEKGLLIEPEALSLLSEGNDEHFAKLIIENLRIHTQKKIITKNLLEQNKGVFKDFLSTLPRENQRKLEKLSIKLGLEIEISKEISPSEDFSDLNLGLDEKKSFSNSNFIKKNSRVVLFPEIKNPIKKIKVEDFTKNLRNRFLEIKKILQEHTELENLVSINKLSKNSQRVSIIGIVYEKRVTKNNNILLDVEDLTGRTRVLINSNKPELYASAQDIALDSILGFSGTGDREIFFTNQIVFPDARLFEKKKSPIEESAIFIGDLHYGSNLFMEDNFLRFIDYLNGNLPQSDLEEIKKIKYLFISGDIVSGVGNYPSQHKDLKIKDLEEQFKGLANLLGKIRKDISIIISPGNHDGVRLMEPQPCLDEKYAWPLYNLENALFVQNPSRVVLAPFPEKNFEGFDVLIYHGFSYAYYSNNISSLIAGGFNSPEKIMAYLLKNRHLAPTNSSTQYFPFEEDPLLIKRVPDIFVSGHSHKLAISSYNGILIISTSTWERETEYQKRKGNSPDFCKVPMLNLKTREIKILDFE